MTKTSSAPARPGWVPWDSLADALSGHRHIEQHDLYGPEGARVYDDTVAADVTEIRELSRLLRKDSGPILELAAGSGRLTLPMLKLRRPLTALDSSETMLSLLADRVAGLPASDRERLTMVCARMQDVDLGDARFGSVVLGTTSISLLTDADRPRLLAAVRRLLLDDGSFWLNVVSVSPEVSNASEPIDGCFDLTGRSGRPYRIHHHWQPGARVRGVAVYALDATDPLPVYTSSPGLVDLARLHDELAAEGLGVVESHDVAAGLPGMDEHYLRIRVTEGAVA